MIPQPGSESESDLVAWVGRIRGGDRSAEDALVRFFQPRIYAFAQRTLRDTVRAEDVVQETLWAAVKTLREGRLEDPPKLAAFVYGVARRRVADLHRKTSRNRHVEWPADFDPPANTSAAEEDRQRMVQAQAVIQDLEPADRNILQMLLVEGLGMTEIGEKLQLRADAVRQRKSRALRRVLERIREFTRPVTPRPSRIAPVERHNKQGRDLQ